MKSCIKRLALLVLALFLAHPSAGARTLDILTLYGPPSLSAQYVSLNPQFRAREGLSLEARDELKAVIEEKFPGIAVTFTEAPIVRGPEDVQPILLELAAGRYDIVISNIMPSLMKDGLLMPLDGLLERETMDLSAQYLDIASRLSREGRLYDLPVTVDPYVLLYSADIFDQRGVAYPEGTWTWADFAETAAKVYWESDPGFFPDPSIREDLANPLFGAKIQPDTLLPVLLAQLGSSGFAGEGQEMRRALDLLLSLKSNPVLFWYESTGPLALGRVAMEPAFVSQGVYFSNNYFVWAQRTVRDELTWGWRPYQNTAPPFDWGIAQLPSFSDGLDVTEALVQSVAIPASARDPLAAWDVVKFLIGRSGAEIFARSGALPANLVDQIPDVWLRTLADLGYKSPQGVGALPTLRYSVAGRQLGIVEFQFRWELSLMLQDLFAGRISLDEAVRRAGEMQRELALGR